MNSLYSIYHFGRRRFTNKYAPLLDLYIKLRCEEMRTSLGTNNCKKINRKLNRDSRIVSTLDNINKT